jgi:hypothetical protein
MLGRPHLVGLGDDDNNFYYGYIYIDSLTFILSRVVSGTEE